jgi:hypothetical protein
MSSADECRDLVESLDKFAKMHGYSDFAELVAKVNVKSVDEAIKIIKAILTYRECIKLIREGGLA